MPPSRQPIWRVTDRDTFLAFRRGQRVRRGPVSVTWLAPTDGDASVRVAYVVGRGAGSAVKRNRIRRRLRAAVREVHRHRGVAPGSYLVGASPDAAQTPWSELVSAVSEALGTAAGRSPR